MRVRPLLVALVLLLAFGPTPAPARADEPPEARAHYEEGLTQYHLGHFEDAAREFKLAYELSQKPKLLFNIAQALRLGGHHEDAIYAYRTYLRLVPDAPNREDVEDFIAESEAAVRAAAERRRAEAAEAERDRARLARAQEEARVEQRLHRAGLITFGSGLLAGAVGTFFAVRASDAAADLTAAADAGSPWTDELERTQNEGERDDVIGTSLIYAGSAAALTGIVIYTWNLWHFSSEPQAPMPRVSAAPSRGGASLCLGWDF